MIMTENISSREQVSSSSKPKTWLQNHKKLIRNALLGVVVAGTATYTVNNWKTAQDRYESGQTEASIDAKHKEQKVLIDAYNEYFAQYEEMGKTLIELQASGDIAGYKNTFKKREKLREEIKSVESDIDKLGNNIQDLKQDMTEGKRQSASEITPIPHIKGKDRRTFKEYQ
jgi:hypothetical protein